MDIVICATQRCGSTLFVEDMRNTEVLGRPQEYFIAWLQQVEAPDWQEKFAELHDKGRGENGVTAVKLMANQLAGVDSRLGNFITDPTDGIFGNVSAAFHDSVWIWLRREDIVEQAISRVMARQTRIYHATEAAGGGHFVGDAKRHDTNYNQNAHYDRREIFQEVNRISLENLTWQHFFESHGIAPLVFAYEEVKDDADMRHLDLIAERLSQTEPLRKKPRKLAKLGNERNREWRNRFLQQAALSNFNLSEFQ